ncbi:MAG: hypothetical protein OXE44_09915 [Nitrospinae bacterium]|nr:hypothetical protein [Nitrospinota bacterium]
MAIEKDRTGRGRRSGFVTVAALMFVLSACGGGGGASVNAPPPAVTPTPPTTQEVQAAVAQAQSAHATPGNDAVVPQPVSAPTPLTVPGPAPASEPDPPAPPVSAPDPPPARNYNWYVPAPRTTPQRSASTVTSTTTSAPAGLPSGEGTVVNMNTFGIWGSHPDFISGLKPNNAPDISVRERQPPASNIEVTATCYLQGEPDNARTCSAFGFDEHGNVITPQAVEKWFTYPSDAGDDDMKVHVHVKRLGYGTVGGKTSLFYWIQGGWPFDDFFVADSFLETPAARSAVQPAAMDDNETGTWAGHVIAVRSDANIEWRGDLIGGDASVTVNFGTSTTVDVNLTNLESSEYTKGSPLVPLTYSSQAWSGLAVTGGSFSSTGSSRTISGTFRDENDADFTQDTVGGVFKVNGSMTGGFVAKRTQ